MLGRAAVHLKQRGPLCDRKGEHANVTKVGFWHWLPLKQLAAECRAWQPVAPNVTGGFHDLAINVARNFQLDPLATPKPRSRKGTYPYLWRSMRTLRFLLIARAGRVTRIGGRNVLRLSQNPATEQLFAKVSHALVALIFGLGLCIGPTPSALAMAAAVLRPGGQTRGRAMPNNDLGSEKLLTKGEVAQLCRVEVRTVDRWLIAGKV